MKWWTKSKLEIECEKCVPWRGPHICKGCRGELPDRRETRRQIRRLCRHGLSPEDIKTVLMPFCCGCTTKLLRVKAARDRNGLPTNPRALIEAKFFLPRNGYGGLGRRYGGKTLKQWAESC